MIGIYTFDNAGSDAHEQDRPLAIKRPCSCGCDNRRDPDMVGYLHAIKDGKGFTITFDDEDTYATVATILEGELNS